MNRREHHRIYVMWHKHLRLRKRAVDYMASKQPLSDKNTIEEAFMWMLHTKGAFLMSYQQYKRNSLSPRSFNKKLLKEVNKSIADNLMH